MAKANLLRDRVFATRRRTGRRDRKERLHDATVYIRQLEREALEETDAQGVEAEPSAADDVEEFTFDGMDEEEEEVKEEKEGEASEEHEAATFQKQTVILVSGDDKRTEFLKLVHEMMEQQTGQRQKSKIIVLANNFESAKALVPAIATKKTVTRSKGRFLSGSKGRVVESKGVVLLNKKDTESAMEGFKSGKYNILVTTEADLSVLWEMRKMISMVINYDMPKDMAAYRHRARFAGTDNGAVPRTVVNFFTPSVANVAFAPALVDYLQNGPSKSDLPPTLLEIANLARPTK